MWLFIFLNDIFSAVYVVIDLKFLKVDILLIKHIYPMN